MGWKEPPPPPYLYLCLLPPAGNSTLHSTSLSPPPLQHISHSGRAFFSWHEHPYPHPVSTPYISKIFEPPQRQKSTYVQRLLLHVYTKFNLVHLKVKSEESSSFRELEIMALDSFLSFVNLNVCPLTISYSLCSAIHLHNLIWRLLADSIIPFYRH